MIRFFILIAIILSLVPNANAAEINIPTIPEVDDGIIAKPETFLDGIKRILQDVTEQLHPSINDALGLCVSLIAAAIIICIIQNIQSKQEHVLQIVSTLAVSGVLLGTSRSFIALGTQTITRISEYGKLLLPVLTTALASQGEVNRSASLYAATATFDALLCAAISTFIIPLVYIFLCMSTAQNATGEQILGKIKDFIKWLITRILKIVLYFFTGFISLSGVISGSADATALKVTKMTISGSVPVVGGMLSEISEALLTSAAMAKNAAGIYGILTFISILVGPFIKIGVQYLLLKATSAICGIFGCKHMVSTLNDFSVALGFLLAMTASVTIMQIFSTVCFMMGTA